MEVIDTDLKDNCFLKTQEFITNITKLCWDSGVDYKIIYYNNDKVIISLKGFSRSKLVMYHDTTIVNEKDINLFLFTSTQEGIKDSTYITSGFFEADLTKKVKTVKFIDKTIFKKFNFKILKREFSKENLDYYKIVSC